MKQLSPIILKDKYFFPIEEEIQRIFNKIMYLPLIRILQKNKEVKNSVNSPLYDAIRNGTVWYNNDRFYGTFNSRISKELKSIGAHFNVASKTWSIPQEYVPAHLKSAQVIADSAYETMRREMLETINLMDVDNVDLISKAANKYDKTISEMNADLNKTITPTAREKIGIPPNLSEIQKARIANEWGDNLDLYIKKWTQKNILKLREQIQPHVLAGGRAEGLEKSIRDNYNVSKRKAKFLARQETSLLMSKFQETRYQDMGLTHYRWSTSHDVRVRQDHAELNGKVFRWDSPPISNKKTGARNNPGCDYECRCVAIALIQ